MFINCGGRESHVAYVEDMYEDASGKKMVLARWFEEQDGEHGVVLPPIFIAGRSSLAMVCKI